MKEQCYEIFLLETITRGKGSQSSRYSLEVLGDAEDILDSILEKFETHSFSFMMGLNISFGNMNWWPWAIFVFSEEYRFAGHLVSIRENKTDFCLTAFSIPKQYSIEKHGVPPVSVINIKNKKILRNLSIRSPLFKSTWNLLKNREDDKRWLIFPDPPKKELLTELSNGDDELFLKMANKT